MADFEGIVEVYDEKFYVNTKENIGISSVLEKIEPLLNKMASSVYISGYSFEDIRQELILIAIDGIQSFDITKDVKLSTFLHVHLKNKLISKLKHKNKMANDATLVLEEKVTDEKKTEDKRYRKIKQEVSFGVFRTNNDQSNGRGDTLNIEETIATENSVFGIKANSVSEIDFEISLQQFLETLDPTMSEIIKLIYYEDLSIKDASQRLNQNPLTISNKLKKLQNKAAFKEMFEDIHKYKEHE
jgi:RNA polymerase sigma factor (sigma-70 family)